MSDLRYGSVPMSIEVSAVSGVGDLRESPALKIIELLRERLRPVEEVPVETDVVDADGGEVLAKA